MKVIVTGGAGFIDSAVIKQYIREADHDLISLDVLICASNLKLLVVVSNGSGYQFGQTDIPDPEAITSIFHKHKPDASMHLVVGSRVDYSIGGATAFLQLNMAEACDSREASPGYRYFFFENKYQDFRFHHVYTDDVCGGRGDEGCFTEQLPHDQDLPCSANKAPSDHSARRLRVLLSDCSTKYGKIILNVIESICALLKQGMSDSVYTLQKRLIGFLDDHRPGYDVRCAIDPSKIKYQLDWALQETFETGLNNSEWYQHVLDGGYQCERFGKGILKP